MWLYFINHWVSVSCHFSLLQKYTQQFQLFLSILLHFLLICIVAGNVGSFRNTNHGVSGSVSFQTATRIILNNFHYDGSGTNRMYISAENKRKSFISYTISYVIQKSICTTIMKQAKLELAMGLSFPLKDLGMLYV